MNLSGLSFNALPPIDLPFRFFISAPIFMLACVGLVFYGGESLWLSRWHPLMLALTHGFTLGFLTMVMLGALLQLLPVIAGIGIPQPRIIASISHAALMIGTLSLLLGFIVGHEWMLYGAMFFLAIGLGTYLLALGWVLIKKISQGDSITGFRLAIVALFITLLIGLALLARNLGFEWITFDKQLTNIHALWGLAGWAGLLIIAVSFQVIPMFHVAPSFPKLVTRYLTLSIFVFLLVFIFAPTVAMPILSLCHGLFALVLLFVIRRRKRKVPDTSIRYWQLAAISLLLACMLYFIPQSLWSHYLPVDKELLLGALFIYGYLMSVIQGMLLKILPFLSYTHLQQRCLVDFSAMQFIPHMHEFLNKKHGQWLFRIHLISSFCLLLVLFQPASYALFGLSLLLEFSGLLLIMIKTMSLYFKINKKITLSAENT